jgi:hypothetical protein
VTCLRFDTGARPSWRRDSRGFLTATAFPTRVGVFVYRRADGSEVRELRPADEVAKAESLATLQGATLTHLHPAEPITPENATQLGIGHIGDDVRMDGDRVTARAVIESSTMIEAVERGDLVELSCGYACSIDPTPGVHNGERYDQVQRDIVYNHVALGPAGWGRAGSQVALRADSDDAMLVGSDDPTPNPPTDGDRNQMVKLRLDGQSVEVSEEAAPVLEALLQKRADAAEARVADAEARVEKAEAALQDATARADKAEARADDAEAKLAKVEGPEALQERVQARLGLERDAAKVLGTEVKLDSLSDAEIRAEALKKARPEFKLDGKSDEYVSALFDAAVLDAEKAADGGRTKLKDALDKAPRADAGEPKKDPHAKRRNAFVDHRAGK